MLQAIPVHAESARYAAPLLFLPELWAPPEIWLPVATFLGHRGWESQLVGLRGIGELGARVDRVTRHVGGLAHAPVLIGHGAGALVALGVARAGTVAAVVLVAPLLPGTPPVRALTRRWDAIAALLRAGAVPPPRGPSARRLFGELPSGLDVERARAVLDVVRGRPLDSTPLGVPTLMVAGDHDPLLPPDAATALASTLDADHATIPGAGHWPILPPAWQHTVGVMHRWLVRRLGEPLLELYAEMMAERDAGDESDEK